MASEIEDEGVVSLREVKETFHEEGNKQLFSMLTWLKTDVGLEMWSFVNKSYFSGVVA